MKLEIFEKENRTRVDLIRSFDFVQYVDKFNGIGTFQMTLPYTEDSLKMLQKGTYILFDDGVMGIVKYRFKERGEFTKVNIKGYLLNKIFEYRSFLKTTMYKGEKAEVSKQMVSDLLIDNEDSRRVIPYISISSEEQYSPASETMSGQYTGKRLNDVIESMFATIGYGYELVPVIVKYNEETDVLTNVSSFEYRVLKPSDRSIENTEGNVPIVFSMSLNNLSNLSYTEDDTSYCSVAVVAGEGTGQDRKVIEVGDTEASGIDRIELYVDARDLQTETESGEVISDEEYNEMLTLRGNEYLKDHLSFQSFEGTIVSGDLSYKYGVDFYKGDYVSIIDEQLNVSIKVQITEVTKSLTQSGEIFDITFGYERIALRQLIMKRGVI